MIKAAGLFILIAGATAAQAEQAPEADVCVVQMEMAQGVMRARQNEMPMPELLAMIPPDNPFYGTHGAMVKMAYGQPAAHAESNKALQERRFGNKVYQMCRKISPAT